MTLRSRARPGSGQGDSDPASTVATALAGLTALRDQIADVAPDALMEYFVRWKRRTTEDLAAYVSDAEATRFGDLRDWLVRQGYWPEPPDDIIREHGRFLVALQEEVRAYPGRFGAAAAHRRADAPKPPGRAPLRRPERITPAWLWQNADPAWLVGTLATLLALLGTAFAAGVRVGANPKAAAVVGPVVGLPPAAPASTTGAGAGTGVGPGAPAPPRRP